MKKQNPKLVRVDKDFDALCKKHNLKKAAMVAEPFDIKDKNFVSSYLKGNKGKKSLMRWHNAVVGLFSQTSMNELEIMAVINILKAYLKNYGVKK